MFDTSHYLPPIWPFGIGLIQLTARLITRVIIPTIHIDLPYLSTLYLKMMEKMMPPKFPMPPVNPETIPAKQVNYF